MKKQYKFRLYQKLKENTHEIFSDIRQKAEGLEVPEDLRGNLGLGGGSGTPPTIPEEVTESMDSASHEVISNASLVDQVRTLVKDVYGDQYDATVVSTAEAALWVSFDSLISPPLLGRGDNYQAAYITPYERHLHHHGGYGRPFPPKYKDLLADRGVTAGELGLQGKRLNNLETVIVPLEGAEYPSHGIKYFPIPMLTDVNPSDSIDTITEVAERHREKLAGFSSLGYDTHGYGYGVKDENGTPELQKQIGKLAQEYNVPYICDNARGLPFIGTDPRENFADVMMYSMDKAAQGPTCGLVLGKEDAMLPIRRAMGVHGARAGTTSTFGKAAYVTFDPGKEALVGTIAALKRLKEHPGRILDNVDRAYDIVKEEFTRSEVLPENGFEITKSKNGAAVEVNYIKTWTEDEFGIPIFSIEDMYASTNLIQVGMPHTGIRPPLCYDGNVFIVMGQENLDSEGSLIEDRMRLAVRALVLTMEVITEWGEKWSGN
ncbi:MAG: hypothetical protein R6V83_10345 [Candidatus Thorarchaeota archaeon]